MPVVKSTLTEAQIEEWIREFHRIEGYYPSSRERKPVPGQPLEKWELLNGNLLRGGRGLPGGSSLARLRNRMSGLAGLVIRVRTPVIEVEPKRTKPLVPDEWLPFLKELTFEDRGIIGRYLAGDTQADIAFQYSLTQAGISYRIQRIQERLAFLHKRSLVPDATFKRTLIDIGVPTMDVTLLVSLRNGKGQSYTAEHMGITQGALRYRFFRTLERYSGKLVRRNKRSQAVLRQLELIRDSLAIMSEKTGAQHRAKY